MITVEDHANPWFMPRSALAPTIHHQLGANRMSTGTGRPMSHPRSRTGRRARRSVSQPAARLANALVSPKVAMKDNAEVVDAMENSRVAISGTTDRSSPTIAPTNALTTTSNVNCCQFARSPSATPECALVPVSTETAPGRARRIMRRSPSAGRQPSNPAALLRRDAHDTRAFEAGSLLRANRRSSVRDNRRPPRGLSEFREDGV